MKKITKRIFAGVLVAVMMTVMIAGCKNDDTGTDADNPQGTPGSTTGAQPEYVYTAQSVPFPLDIEGIFSVAYHFDKIYFNGSITENTVDGEDGSAYITNTSAEIHSMNIDGTGLTKLTGYTPPISKKDDISSYVYTTKMTVDDEGFIWVVEEWSYHTYDLPDDFDAEKDALWEHQVPLETGFFLRKFDTDGSELLSIDITDLQGDYKYLLVMAFAVETASDGSGVGSDASENIYLGIGDYEQPGQSVYVLDNEGNIQLQLKTEYSFSRFIPLPDGTMAMPPDQNSIFTGIMSAGTLPTVDFSAKARGKTIEVPDIGEQYAYSINYHKGPSAIRTAENTNGEADDFDLLISDNISLHGYKLGEATADKLLNWIDCNLVVGNIQDIFMTPDGRIICTNNMWSGPAGAEIIILTKTHISELPEKTVITLAGFMINYYMKNAVAEFNKTSLTHSIEIKDYMDNSENNLEAGITKLLSEISSGTVPDILETHFLRGRGLENTGLYADLYPYIDADPELDRSDFIGPVLEAVETDGKLYQAFPSFTIRTVIGHPSILGAQPGWNIDEFAEVLDANSDDADLPMGYAVTNTEILKDLVNYNIDEFIDWNAGKVSFDSESFKRLLEISGRFPFNTDQTQELSDADAIKEGRQIMAKVTITSYLDLQVWKELSGTVWLDGEYVCKGYPTAQKDGHIVTAANGLAIIESSPNKNAAWSFVKTVLDPNWQLYNTLVGFPSTQEAYDRYYKRMLDEEQSYTVITEPRTETFEITPTQEDFDFVNALIEQLPAGRSRAVDDVLLDIIADSASDYFSGAISAQQAAAAIQDRASTYVSERS